MNQELFKVEYLVVECSKRTVLSCLEQFVCWRHFGTYFSHHLAKSDKIIFTSVVKVDQPGRPLPSKSLGILVGLTLKLDSLCIIVNVVENIWTFRFVFNIFGLIAWKGLYW